MNPTTAWRAAEASRAGPGASCAGAIGAAGPAGCWAHAASASTGNHAIAARARIVVRMIRPVGFSRLGSEEPAGRPRAATLEERPDSTGQGAGEHPGGATRGKRHREQTAARAVRVKR